MGLRTAEAAWNGGRARRLWLRLRLLHVGMGMGVVAPVEHLHALQILPGAHHPPPLGQVIPVRVQLSIFDLDAPSICERHPE
eukprot:COSAG05_NODE_3361_length_2117_cov_1.666006_2_plen_82_part_00